MSDTTPRLALLKPVVGATGWGNDMRSTIDTLDSSTASKLEFPADLPTPASPATEDDEFDDGSIAGKWAWRQQGTSTIVEQNGYELLTTPADASFNWRIREQTAPSTPYTITARLTFGADNIVTNSSHGGIGLLNSSTGYLVVCGKDMTGGTGVWTPAGLTGSPTNLCYGQYRSCDQYYQITNDGTTVTYRSSQDGISWSKNGSHTLASHLTSTGGSVDKIIIVAGTSASAACRVAIYWFRKT